MKRLLLSAALVIGLSGCAQLGALAGGPATVANQTVLDEKLAIFAEQSYQAAASLILARNQTVAFSPETKERIKAADRKAYEAVLGVRAAYRAGNASSYSMAAAEAQSAIATLLTLIN